MPATIIQLHSGNYTTVPSVPWYHIWGQLIGIAYVLLILAIITGLIFSFIAIWRMMKAQEELTSAVKEISAQLKEAAAQQKQEIKEQRE